MGAADLVEGFGEASLPGDVREAGGAARLNILMVDSAATFVTGNDVTYKSVVVKMRRPWHELVLGRHWQGRPMKRAPQ